MQVKLLDHNTSSKCPTSLDDVYSTIGPLTHTGEGDTCLIAHAGDRLLGAMRVRLPHYPMIAAEVPVVCRDVNADKVIQALLTALQREVLQHVRIEAEVIQDMIPAETQAAVAKHLLWCGFEEIGQSIYMSKSLTPVSAATREPEVELIRAGDCGMDRFLQAMVACAQPPTTDRRIQPHCLSLEGAAMTIQDLAHNDLGQIDPARCVLANRGTDMVAVIITHAGFVSWIAVHPNARRCGIGRQVLLALEQLWFAQGISKAGLQVLSTNSVALALYRSLGYASHGEHSPRIWRWHMML